MFEKLIETKLKNKSRNLVRKKEDNKGATQKLIHYKQESALITVYEKLSKDPLKNILSCSYT